MTIPSTFASFTNIVHSWQDSNGQLLLSEPTDEESHPFGQLKSNHFSFEFNDLSKKVVCPFNAKAPDYRIVVQGLNLSGICQTSTCVAFRDYVTIQRGLSKPGCSFNIPLEIDEAQCPKCHQVAVKVNNMILYDCKYFIKGKLIKPRNEVIKQEDRAPSGNDYLTFDPAKNNSEWRYLVVTISKI